MLKDENEREYGELQPGEGVVQEIEQELEEGEVKEQPKIVIGGGDADMSDLFRGPSPDDEDINSDDLTSLDIEDVYGGDPDMSDLTDVNMQRDIIGTPIGHKKKRVAERYRIVRRRRAIPPDDMGGFRGW